LGVDAQREFVGIEVDKPLSKEEFEARVKGSFGFLSAREPELNSGEYAILEKFVPFLEEDPEFALDMIEGLSQNNEGLTASFDFVLGNLYVQSLKLDKAEASYKKAIEKYPDYLRAWRSVGLLYMSGDDLENALKAFTKAIQLGDTDPLTFGQIGYCFYKKKEYLSALSAYTQAVLYDPENESWMRGKVATLTALNDFEQSNVILNALVRRKSEIPEYWMELANNWVRLKEPSKAAACLEFLRGAGMETGGSMEMLGMIYVNEEMYPQAYDVYSGMLAKGFDVRGASVLRCAGKLQQSGMGSKAADLLDSFLETVTDLRPSERVGILRYQSRIAEEGEEYAKAKELIVEALSLNELDGESLIALGRIEYYLDDPAAAFVALGKAERMKGVADQAIIIQAQMLAEKKAYDQAVRKLEVALLNGGSEWIRRYYERMRLQATKAEIDRIALSQFYAE